MTQEDWEARLGEMWDGAMADLSTHPGFMGAIALWNTEEVGTATILGFWDTMEHRLNYEADSANTRSTFFDRLYAERPTRTRYLVSRSTFV
jgi:heme-degrading monooxygenase HmoA